METSCILYFFRLRKKINERIQRYPWRFHKHWKYIYIKNISIWKVFNTHFTRDAFIFSLDDWLINQHYASGNHTRTPHQFLNDYRHMYVLPHGNSCQKIFRLIFSELTVSMNYQQYTLLQMFNYTKYMTNFLFDWMATQAFLNMGSATLRADGGT